MFEMSQYLHFQYKPAKYLTNSLTHWMRSGSTVSKTQRTALGPTQPPI